MTYDFAEHIFGKKTDQCLLIKFLKKNFRNTYCCMVFESAISFFEMRI